MIQNLGIAVRVENRHLTPVLSVKGIESMNINVKNIFIFIAMALSLLSLEVVAKEGLFDEKNLPVPDYAQSVNRFNLSKDSFSQVNFQVGLDHDDENVVKFYEEVFVSRDWRICRQKGELSAREAYINSRGINISQLTRWFLSPGKEQIVVIRIQKQEGELDLESGYDGKNVVVAMYDVIDPMVLNMLSLVCE